MDDTVMWFTSTVAPSALVISLAFWVAKVVRAHQERATDLLEDRLREMRDTVRINNHVDYRIGTMRSSIIEPCEYCDVVAKSVLQEICHNCGARRSAS